MKKTFIIILSFFTFSLFGQSFVQNSMMMRPKDTTAIYGLLNFDGVNDYVLLNSSPIIETNATVIFNIFKSGLGNGSYVIDFPPITTEGLYIVHDGIRLHIVTRSSLGEYKRIYTINSYNNRSIECKLIKTGGTHSFYINDTLQTGTTTPDGYASVAPRFGLGYNDAIYLTNILLWNIRLYNSSSIITNRWLGQPNGNTNAAWEDQIGTIDGTVYGSPTTTDITY